MTNRSLALLLLVLIAPAALAAGFDVWHEAVINPSPEGCFGCTLDNDGNRLASVALHETVDGLTLAGAVYIYVRTDGEWGLQQRIVGPDPGPNRRFGRAIALVGDELAIAGGTDDGQAVFVYRRSGVVWTLQQTIPRRVAAPIFGYSLALHEDDLVVGALGTGSTPGEAYVYHRGVSGFEYQQTLTSTRSSAMHFARDVDVDGVTIAVSDTSNNEVSLFERNEGSGPWERVSTIGRPDPANLIFGEHVDLDAGRMVVGVSGGRMAVYVRTGSGWVLEKLLHDNAFTYAEISGDLLAGWFMDGSSNNWIAIYDRSGGTWVQKARIPAAGGFTGLTFEGNTLAFRSDFDDVSIYRFARHSGEGTLYWRHTNSLNSQWTMNGLDFVSSDPLPRLFAPWELKGALDFNADGQRDLLWWHPSGIVRLWEMSGTTRTNIAGLPGYIRAGWELGGAADFNEDGDPDLLWRNETDGRNMIWLLDGYARDTVAELPPLATSWMYAGAGDFDGDGDPDLVWQHSTGQVIVWEMNAAARVTTHVIGTTDLHLGAVTDLTGDGVPDLVFDGDGDNAAWVMQGFEYVFEGAVHPVTDDGWELRAPR